MMLLALAIWLTPPQSPMVGQPFVIEGRLRYVDGDRLLVDCGKHKPCIETLIRDKRLDRTAWPLQGKKLRLRVERVAACGEWSSEVACAQSTDRTALRIVEWLDPR